MKLRIFNACLLAGWLMVTVGIAIVSVPAALVAGGVTLMGLTLLVARAAGITGN